MEFVLTDHAERRLRKRNIHLDWIAAALDHPARTENDAEDPALVHALLPIADRNFRVLRVIYNESVSPVAVVTAYFDDKVVDL